MINLKSFYDDFIINLISVLISIRLQYKLQIQKKKHSATNLKESVPGQSETRTKNVI